MIGITQTIHAFLPMIRKGGLKKVMVVTSAYGSPNYALKARSAGAAPYATSKAAVNMIVAKYAVATRDEGIIFLGVSPGFVKTRQGGEWS